MKYNIFFVLLSVIWLICFCDESLPPRITPADTLKITEIAATQGAVGGGAIVIAIVIIGKNSYHETFQDTVNLKGNVHIWWKNRPEVEANLFVDNSNFVEPTPMRGRMLTLDPDGEFFLRVNWYLTTDDGRNIIEMLDYSGNDIRNGILYARPEQFIIETKLTIFDQIGLITSHRYEFTLKGWKKIG